MKPHSKIWKPHLDIINCSVKQNFTREYSSALTFANSTTNNEAFHQSYSKSNKEGMARNSVTISEYVSLKLGRNWLTICRNSIVIPCEMTRKSPERAIRSTSKIGPENTGVWSHITIDYRPGQTHQYTDCHSNSISYEVISISNSDKEGNVPVVGENN